MPSFDTIIIKFHWKIFTPCSLVTADACSEDMTWATSRVSRVGTWRQTSLNTKFYPIHHHYYLPGS